ncbi:IS21 family transposase [Laribacter hongkongensis]|uniref:Integrase catalytic subunit n=1 Tax=Laribacter hongkongensis TaxID=168471 RepID=A0A248LG03_9NEIS|nr:IS21 family transposase [Laribacter hongkongensis]ASJ23740.1 integrase catalytic subunit [Laribacter hongkongensis]MCG9040492.1 IS21 family transposase [Laribacter hongkongensis]MCG9067146.1 IS21 family transposase [Laribacter hongkongensis]MCG9087557.1 IS21 family transposase [Laribacter hongkongensis]MCG9108142.1 IS21 family transposase [Laribacter hongkongensis]
MQTLSKLRRMVLRDKVSVREAARRLRISRNTAAKWLAEPQMVEPTYPQRQSAPSVIDPYREQLASWLKTDSYRGKRERRSVRAYFEAIRAMGFKGSKSLVYNFCSAWRQAQENAPRNAGFVPLSFELGEAFQFDWSCEYVVIGGLRKRLEVAHTKLAASRAFVLVAYFTQSHEMLFDAHTQAFAVFGGVPRRGIYDNMRTAVDKMGRGKERSVNARFESMTGHYLFEAEFCNRAAGWEKGRVEKNVQDRRRHIWREAAEKRWASLAELNAWLLQACQASWSDLTHPDWPELTVADVWQDERACLMALPKAFDGYVEQPARVTSTSLIHFQRNRYSVPCEWVNTVVSLRAYPDILRVVGGHGEIVDLVRSFERDQTFYDWRHYIALIERKPGALRNGAPFKTMPEALQELQRQLLKNAGGDRVMAQVLSAIPLHGLGTVVQAIQIALDGGRVSVEHVMNTLGRLKDAAQPTVALQVDTPLALHRPPQANVSRYDSLRAVEVSHVQ